ncbi:MAG: arsenic resistance protein, partial [Nitrososphaera sp.]
LQTLAASFLAFAAFSIIGYVSSPRQDRAAGLIAMTYVNNTLVMVFAAQFFGPQVAALAAVYNIPYYAGILVIKKLLSR